MKRFSPSIFGLLNMTFSCGMFHFVSLSATIFFLIKEFLTRAYFYSFILLCCTVIFPFSEIFPVFIVMLMKLSILQRFICNHILWDSFPKRGVEQQPPIVYVEMFTFSKSLILLHRPLGVIPAWLYEDAYIPGIIVRMVYLCAERCWGGKARVSTAAFVAGLARGG